jgi:hypothetical protein
MGLPKHSGHVWIVNGSVVTDSEGKLGHTYLRNNNAYLYYDIKEQFKMFSLRVFEMMRPTEVLKNVVPFSCSFCIHA